MAVFVSPILKVVISPIHARSLSLSPSLSLFHRTKGPWIGFQQHMQLAKIKRDRMRMRLRSDWVSERGGENNEASISLHSFTHSESDNRQSRRRSQDPPWTELVKFGCFRHRVKVGLLREDSGKKMQESPQIFMFFTVGFNKWHPATAICLLSQSRIFRWV